MKITINLIFYFLLLVMISCDGSSDTEQNNQDTNDNTTETNTVKETSELEDTKLKIRDILLSYYEDLSRERLSEEKYFAENILYFFGKSNMPREQVAQSIRNGFSETENRIIQLDSESLNVNPSNGGFVAEFSGQVQFTRSTDQSLVKEAFYNRVTFNEELKITRYESVESNKDISPPTPLPKATNPQTLRQSTSDPSDAINAFLNAWKQMNNDNINEFIYPETGIYYVTRPGAMDAVYQGNTFQGVFDKAYTSWTSQLLRNAECELKNESLPEYDCENFSKTGCFIAETSNYTHVSDLMEVLMKNDLGNYSKEEIIKAKNTESYITHQVVVTNSALSMCWGKVDNQWYLFVLDIASYDCSA